MFISVEYSYGLLEDRSVRFRDLQTLRECMNRYTQWIIFDTPVLGTGSQLVYYKTQNAHRHTERHISAYSIDHILNFCSWNRPSARERKRDRETARESER